MELKLPKGKYVVAVSGGVDSVALLDMLSKQNELDLAVAHFDHGIRSDSAQDRLFVQSLAQKYALPFEYEEGNLGPNASEAAARSARYGFLRRMQQKHGAKAIITAHHQDDMLETAIINLLRGTGRKGLTSLASSVEVVRPLLPFSKRQIQDYARLNKLEWHEDSTNADTRYLRNHVRHQIVPKLSTEQRRVLLQIIESQRAINIELDELLQSQPGSTLDKRWFTALPHAVAREVMASWLRSNGLQEFDRPAIERAVAGAKTAKVGKQIEVKKGIIIEVGRDGLALSSQMTVGHRKTN